MPECILIEPQCDRLTDAAQLVQRHPIHYLVGKVAGDPAPGEIKRAQDTVRQIVADVKQDLVKQRTAVAKRARVS